MNARLMNRPFESVRFVRAYSAENNFVALMSAVAAVVVLVL